MAARVSASACGRAPSIPRNCRLNPFNAEDSSPSVLPPVNTSLLRSSALLRSATVAPPTAPSLIHLELEVIEGKIASFRFHGDDFQKAARTLAPPLSTGPFLLFDDPKGTPLPEKKLGPGKVYFTLQLANIVAKDGQIPSRGECA